MIRSTHSETRTARSLLAGALIALTIAVLGLVACGRAEVTQEEGGFATPTPAGAGGGGLLGQPTETPAAGEMKEKEKVEVELEAQNDSGQDGVATLEARDGKTEVKIALKPSADGVPQAAHIHSGTCDALGDIKYPLEKVVNGMSSSTVDVALDDLMSGDARVVNVHKDESDSSDSIACGEIEGGEGGKEMAPGTGTPSGTPGGGTPSGTPGSGTPAPSY